MTDLANVKSLAQGNSQLPSSWYADPRIHELEQKHLFAKAQTYIGHTSMVPNVGDYRVLDWMG
ncbi:MAG: aromatic ring-hydroxylating dioxygenase subunit alpha, partial [Burkholderiales bacterium]